MKLEPGIGWGPAKLGASLGQFVDAFGPASREQAFDDVTFIEWRPLGLQVCFSFDGERAGEAESLSLFAHDPDEPGFAPAAAATDEGLGFGLDEARVRALCGEPRAFHTSGDGAWARLEYEGVSVRLVNDTVVRLTVEPKSPEANELKNDELIAAIIAQPDADAGYLVYGDWLEQQGHPRGGFVALQARARTAGPRLEATEQAYFDQHEEALLGPLAPYADMVTERSWHLGFLRAVKIANTFERSPIHSGELEEFSVSSLLALLLSSQAGQFVRDLTVGIVDFEQNDYIAEIGVLAAKQRPLIRTLFLGDFYSEETELNWSALGNAQALWRALPNLEDLMLRSGSMAFGAIEAPRLRAFSVATGGLRKAELASVANAQWPKLEQLTLQIGSRRYGSDVEASDLEPVLASAARWRSLVHLGITNTEHADVVAAMVAESAVLPQLERLDLSLGTLGVEGARVILKHVDRFRHLTRLDLRRNWLHPNDRHALRAALPNVLVDDQRDDEGDAENRYIAAGE